MRGMQPGIHGGRSGGWRPTAGEHVGLDGARLAVERVALAVPRDDGREWPVFPAAPVRFGDVPMHVQEEHASHPFLILPDGGIMPTNDAWRILVRVGRLAYRDAHHWVVRQDHGLELLPLVYPPMWRHERGYCMYGCCPAWVPERPFERARYGVYISP
jgi:hypothetical protein